MNEARSGLLRDALEIRSEHVEFADSAGWYQSPSAALEHYRTFVTQKFESGATWIRIVAEPVWVGRSDAEIAVWMRYESIVNLALASAPVTIICAYDTRSMSEDLPAEVHRTHPWVVHGSE